MKNLLQQIFGERSTQSEGELLVAQAVLDDVVLETTALVSAVFFGGATCVEDAEDALERQSQAFELARNARKRYRGIF